MSFANYAISSINGTAESMEISDDELIRLVDERKATEKSWKSMKIVSTWKIAFLWLARQLFSSAQIQRFPSTRKIDGKTLLVNERRDERRHRCPQLAPQSHRRHHQHYRQHRMKIVQLIFHNFSIFSFSNYRLFTTDHVYDTDSC